MLKRKKGPEIEEKPSAGGTIDLFAAQAQTLLGGINEILMTGNFASSPEEPVEEGEIAVTDLTAYERAIFSVLEPMRKEHNSIAREFEGVPVFLIPEDKKARVKRLGEDRRICNDLMWLSIEGRIGVSSDVSLRIRAGFKVVLAKGTESDGLKEVQLKDEDLAFGPGTDLFIAQAKTILAGVNEILASGNFASSPEDPVEEGDTVIDDATGYEKALFCARNILVDKFNSLADELNQVPPFSRPKEKVTLSKRLKREIELCEKLGWGSIYRRLNLAEGGFGIRAGFKIVKLPERPSSPSLDMSESGSESGIALPDLATLALMSVLISHDCAQCPAYDACDNPEKKPRRKGAIDRFRSIFA